MLEHPNESIRTVVEYNRLSGIKQCLLRQSRQQLYAFGKALPELNLTAHGALGDRGDLRTHPVPTGKLIDHFHIDQRRVHIKGNQPTIAPIHRICLHAEIEGQLARCAHEIGLQSTVVVEIAAQTHFDAGAFRLANTGQRDAPRQPAYAIDVQSMACDHGSDGRELLTREARREHRDDVARFALLRHPFAIARLGDRCEAQRHTDLPRLRLKVVEHVTGL